MKNFAAEFLLLIVTVFALQPVFGQDNELVDIKDQPTDRRAQTGFKFLSVSLDARAAGLGNAMTSLETSSPAMFYNTAGMARFRGFSLSFGQTQYIADFIYNMVTGAYGTKWGVFGMSFVSVDYGDFLGTIRSDFTDEGFENTGVFSPTAMAVGIGYANALTEKFSVGGNVKYVLQDLGETVVSLDSLGAYVKQSFSTNTYAFDFGVLYKTGFHSLNFAISVRNFAKDLVYVEEQFELPITFHIGTSMNVMDFTQIDKSIHSLLISADWVNNRDFSEQIKLGGEYSFMNLLALRAGYVYPSDEESLSFGVGLHKGLGKSAIGVDYTYTQFGIFNDISRITLNLSF